MHLANNATYCLAMYNRCLLINIAVNLGIKICMMGPTFLRNVTNGHACKDGISIICTCYCRCYLMAILSIQHNLPQKLDLEAVASS